MVFYRNIIHVELLDCSNNQDIIMKAHILPSNIFPQSLRTCHEFLTHLTSMLMLLSLCTSYLCFVRQVKYSSTVPK